MASSAQTWLLLILHLSCFQLSFAQACAEADIEALLEWPMASRLGWNLTTSPAGWPGLNCSSASGQYSM